MPEGPSIVILKEAVQLFKGKKVLSSSGNAKIDHGLLEGKKVKNVLCFGKHFLIVFAGVTIKIHFLMFGSYRVNERKETPVRLSLLFDDDEINFYSCAVSLIFERLDEVYDCSADVMSDTWKDI